MRMWLAAALGALVAAPAFAQTAELGAVIDRLNRVERDLRDLQGQVYQGDAPAFGAPAATPGASAATTAPVGAVQVDDQAAARLFLQISDLQREVAALTGAIEQIRFEQTQTAGRLDNFIRDMEFRLGAAPGATGGPQPLGTAPQPGAVGQPSLTSPIPSAGPQPLAPGVDNAAGAAAAAPPSTPVSITLPDAPDAAFDYAYGLLLQGDYPGAEAAMAAFLEKHADHAKAPEAQHRLGEIYFVRGDYANAAQAFLKNVQTYPKSDRAADSLLRLGMSLAELGEKDEACKTFQALPSRYPSASENILRRTNTEKNRAGCA